MEEKSDKKSHYSFGMTKMWLSLVFLLVLWDERAQGSGPTDPELKMNTIQIINHWGYPAQEHGVVTADNYILTVHRIPFGKKSGQSANKPVVFFQHGLEDSSATWVINLPDQSAGFIFADAGYDVWLGNMRGNTYGRDHLKYSTKSHDFWKFSFDEMTRYDLEAQIDYVLKATNQTSLIYVGHSQGTLTMFGKLSEDQEFAKKIKSFYGLAPVGRVQKIQGFFDVVAHYLFTEIKLFYYLFGDGEFLPPGDLMDLIAKYVCGTFVGGEFCDTFIMLIFGVNSNQMNVTRTPVYFDHIPAGTSTLNVMHWIQMVRSGKVAKYDFGSVTENRKHYNQDTPPLYDLTKVNAPMYLYWSPGDWIADEADINEYLLATLPKEYIKGVTKLESYSHMDFTWGSKAAAQIYQPIVDQIKKDLNPTP